MNSALTTIGLPVALAIIMFGLGLSLTPDSFKRVGRSPKPVIVALACQLIALPLICFGLIKLFDLPPLLGIGMMLLAASPGGTSANLFSHLFRGDVALNVSLTTVNSVLAIVTLPLIANLTIAHYGLGGEISMQFHEVVQVFSVVLVPVAIGMVVRAKAPAFAIRMDRPVRIGSAVILAVMVLGILVNQAAHAVEYFARVGLVAGLFCAISLLLGYYVPRAAGVREAQAISSSMEVGIHNSMLAIYIGAEILKQNDAAVPAAVYSLIMFAFATIWGYLLTRKTAARPA
jgi:BASS family bile acid:Na+ symporter